MQLAKWFVGLCVFLGAAASWAQSQPVPHYTIEVGRPNYKLLPEGAALCAALGIKPDSPCDDQVILEQSQHSTDKKLWVEKLISGQSDMPLDRCFQPTAIMTYEESGIIHACHVTDDDDTVTALDIQRLHDVAARLNADPNKTLAKHQWIMSFKNLWKRVNP